MIDSSSPRAIASLVFGILAFTGLPVVGAVLAVALGSGERGDLARAGALLGWIHLALVALAVLLVVVLAVPLLVLGHV